jgi:acetyl esterase
MNLKLPSTAIRNLLKVASHSANLLGPRLVNHKKVEVKTGLFYGSARKTYPRLIDVYRPRGKIGQLPIAIFVHGGGFMFFSKDSHAAASARLAESGYVVFCMDYSLSPDCPYPAGLVDVMDAYQWIAENAATFEGDVNDISLIGESAGSNLSLALCLQLFEIRKLENYSFRSPNLPKPTHLILHCGHLQVTDVERYENDPRCFALAYTRIAQIQEYYLTASRGSRDQDWGLANPLIEIEKLAADKKSLPTGFPKVFAPVGENDPIINDSERLAIAMKTLGQPNVLKVYAGQGHAFNVFPFKKAAVECWNDIVQFMRKN